MRLRPELWERIEFYCDHIPHPLGLRFETELWDATLDEVTIHAYPSGGWTDDDIQAAAVLFDLWETPTVARTDLGPVLRWTPEEATVIVLHDPQPFVVVGECCQVELQPPTHLGAA
jgi:hypothetical protein